MIRDVKKSILNIFQNSKKHFYNEIPILGFCFWVFIIILQTIHFLLNVRR